MDLKTKKLSPQAIYALQEALSVLFWKKEELQDFVKLTLNNHPIIGTINWNNKKRISVKELIGRMSQRQDIFKDDLVNLILAVVDYTEFPHLEFWDPDGSLRVKAKKEVENLRNLSKGYLQISREQEEARKRKLEIEKKIAETKSLEAELAQLRKKFHEIALNKNLQQRGYQLEKFLIELFMLYELNPKGSFKNYGEQIDGAFTFEGTDYLLEAKWKDQVNRSDLATFCYKVESKLRVAMGLMITMDGLTPEAIAPDFKSIIIMDGIDVNAIVDGRVTLPDLLYRKRRKANESGKIYVNFHEL